MLFTSIALIIVLIKQIIPVSKIENIQVSRLGGAYMFLHCTAVLCASGGFVSDGQ